MVKRICEICKNTFGIKQSDINRGRGRFCSKKCSGLGKLGSNNPAYKHGNTPRATGQTKEYRTWADMKQRTTNPNEENGHYYQDRGIVVCNRWINSFENFLADMGKAPTPKHSLDRIDNDGDYEPGNCKWSTHKEQMSNTRATKLIEFNGRVETQEEWGRITGIGGLCILKRLKRGWSIEKTLTTPKLR